MYESPCQTGNCDIGCISRSNEAPLFLVGCRHDEHHPRPSERALLLGRQQWKTNKQTDSAAQSAHWDESQVRIVHTDDWHLLPRLSSPTRLQQVQVLMRHGARTIKAGCDPSWSEIQNCSLSQFSLPTQSATCTQAPAPGSISSSCNSVQTPSRLFRKNYVVSTKLTDEDCKSVLCVLQPVNV